MSIDQRIIEQLAQEYIEAEDTFSTIEPLTTRYPDLTLEDAYKIQGLVLEDKLQRGEKIVGAKVAATSKTIQEQFNMDSPQYGTLLERHTIANGETVPRSRFIAPWFETEIAFVLRDDLAGPGVSREDALVATEAVMAAFEINDCRTRDWQIGGLEIVADSCLTGGYVVSGRPVPVEGIDLGSLNVSVAMNGEVIHTATSDAVLGHPANSLAWLANRLSEDGRRLEKGQVVISGSMTRTTPVDAGDTIEATFDHLGTVSVSFS